MICCGNHATAFGHCTRLFPFSTGSVHCKSIPDSGVFKLASLSSKITSPLLCSLTFAGQHPQDSHLLLSVAITSSTDLTYFKLSYTLFISPPTSPCINCVCFPSLPLTASHRHYCYFHPFPPSLHSLPRNMGPALLTIPVLGTGSDFL